MIDLKSGRDEATVRNYFGGFHYVFVCERILMSLITSPLARCLYRLMSGFVNGQLKKEKKKKSLLSLVSWATFQIKFSVPPSRKKRCSAGGKHLTGNEDGLTTHL